jgi:hypothetical protein
MLAVARPLHYSWLRPGSLWAPEVIVRVDLETSSSLMMLQVPPDTSIMSEHVLSNIAGVDDSIGTPSKIDASCAPKFHVSTLKGSCFGEEFPRPRYRVAASRLVSPMLLPCPSRREHWANSR